MAEYIKSVSDAVDSAAEKTAGAVKGTLGESVANTIASSGHALADGITTAGEKLGYHQDSSTQAKEDVKDAAHSVKAAAKDKAGDIEEGLGQAKTNAKVEGEKAHNKTESTFNSLSAEAKSALSDAQQSTASALHATADKIDSK